MFSCIALKIARAPEDISVGDLSYVDGDFRNLWLEKNNFSREKSGIFGQDLKVRCCSWSLDLTV